ncbi:MAG: hypothetical protein M9949_06065 [Candidatus Kapabacteria bacterium]|nr:hypothetical protein [Candidatus Kapabacteria bacterium]
MIKADVSNKIARLCQGDIIRDVELIEKAEILDTGLYISKIVFPYIIVLTQDCDLEQDYNNRTSKEVKNQDKHILSVIVAPLYNLAHVYNGEHLSELKLVMHNFNDNSKTHKGFLEQNNNPRYHYMEFAQSVRIVNSVIDFKHYFTVNNEGLKEKKASNFVCKVSELYREQISLRFANYLSRIGLP